MRQATKDRRPFLPFLERCEERTLPTLTAVLPSGIVRQAAFDASPGFPNAPAYTAPLMFEALDAEVDFTPEIQVPTVAEEPPLIASLTRTAMMSGGGSVPITVVAYKPTTPPLKEDVLPALTAQLRSEVMSRTRTILHLASRQLDRLNADLERMLRSLVQQLEQLNLPPEEPLKHPTNPPESEPLTPKKPRTVPPEDQSHRAALWAVVLGTVAAERRRSSRRRGRHLYRLFRQRFNLMSSPVP